MRYCFFKTLLQFHLYKENPDIISCLSSVKRTLALTGYGVWYLWATGQVQGMNLIKVRWGQLEGAWHGADCCRAGPVWEYSQSAQHKGKEGSMTVWLCSIVIERFFFKILQALASFRLKGSLWLSYAQSMWKRSRLSPCLQDLCFVWLFPHSVQLQEAGCSAQASNWQHCSYPGSGKHNVYNFFKAS